MSAALGAAIAAGGCQEPDDDGMVVPRTALVRIIDTELLNPPEILSGRVYTPGRIFTLPGADGLVSVVGFYLTVSAEDPTVLDLRVLDVARQATVPVVRIPTPALAPADDVAAGLFDPDTRARLLDGACIFWVEPGPADSHQRRLGIAAPQAELGDEASIEVFSSTTSTGAPLGGDRITLAREFFYMATMGDSAMWGNGLEDKDKFSALVAHRIGAELGVHVVRNVRAVSGATIRTHPADGMCYRRCGDGEVPEVFTSITLQANTLERPELYDLILLDGCGNDVQLERILSSTDNRAEIRDLTREFCVTEMANLLIRVRTLAPQAPIVVTGYFPFVSDESDLSGITTWASANGIELGSEEQIAAALLNFVINSAAFQTESTASLAAAVELVNELDAEDPAIAFVDPGYGPANATFAPDAWLWGLTEDIPLAMQLNLAVKLFPEDPKLDERVKRCTVGTVAPNVLACVYGALGHPNVAGAQAYATRIETALRGIGVLPAGAGADVAAGATVDP